MSHYRYPFGMKIKRSTTLTPHKDFTSYLRRTRGYAPNLLESEQFYKLIHAPNLKAHLREILRIRHEPEKAREAEDFLHTLVLTAVALGHPDSQDLSRMALMSLSIPFSRHGEEVDE